MTVKDLFKLFGGARFIAEKLKLAPSTVYRWNYPKSKGGTDGVPREHILPLWELGNRRGIKVTLEQIVAVKAVAEIETQ